MSYWCAPLLLISLLPACSLQTLRSTRHLRGQKTIFIDIPENVCARQCDEILIYDALVGEMTRHGYQIAYEKEAALYVLASRISSPRLPTKLISPDVVLYGSYHTFLIECTLTKNDGTCVGKKKVSVPCVMSSPRDPTLTATFMSSVTEQSCRDRLWPLIDWIDRSVREGQ